MIRLRKAVRGRRGASPNYRRADDGTELRTWHPFKGLRRPGWGGDAAYEALLGRLVAGGEPAHLPQATRNANGREEWWVGGATGRWLPRKANRLGSEDSVDIDHAQS